MTPPAVSGTDPATWRSSGARSPRRSGSRNSSSSRSRVTSRCGPSTRSPAAVRSTSPSFSTRPSWRYLKMQAARATIGSRSSTATADPRGSAGSSPTPRRPSRRCSPGSAWCCCPPAAPRSIGVPVSRPCACAASHTASLRCCGETRITAKPSATSSPPPSGLCSWTSPPRSDRRRRRSRPPRPHQNVNIRGPTGR